MNLKEMFPNGLSTTVKPKPTALTTLQDDPSVDCEEWVFELNGVAVADSRIVGKVFGKAHRHVLEAIDNLINGIYPIVEEAQDTSCADFSAQLKNLKIADLFIAGEYQDRFNKTHRLYHLTKQGFNLAVFGFTGQKALIHKLLFVKRYDAMETYIQDGMRKPQSFNMVEIATIAAQAAVQAIVAVLPDIGQGCTRKPATGRHSAAQDSRRPACSTSRHVNRETSTHISRGRI